MIPWAWHSPRPAGTFSLIMFDLDRFKTVNDRFGHGVGDQVLQRTETAKMISI